MQEWNEQGRKEGWKEGCFTSNLHEVISLQQWLLCGYKWQFNELDNLTDDIVNMRYLLYSEAGKNVQEVVYPGKCYSGSEAYTGNTGYEGGIHPECDTINFRAPYTQEETHTDTGKT